MNQKADVSALTAEQQATFAKVNALFGLGPDEVTFSWPSVVAADRMPATGRRPAPGLILSSDPAESHVPPHFVPVGSIAELRKIAGYDDIHPQPTVREEDEQYYPGPLSEDEKGLLASQSTGLKPNLSPELRARVERAATAYVMLNPERVREYESLINAALFPGQVAVFVAPDLLVKSGEVYRITGDGQIPVAVNFTTVTVEAGGCIAIDVNCILNCQTFTQL